MQDGTTALIMAAQSGHQDIAETLINANADPNIISTKVSIYGLVKLLPNCSTIQATMKILVRLLWNPFQTIIISTFVDFFYLSVSTMSYYGKVILSENLT